MVELNVWLRGNNVLTYNLELILITCYLTSNGKILTGISKQLNSSTIWLNYKINVHNM